MANDLCDCPLDRDVWLEQADKGVVTSVLPSRSAFPQMGGQPTPISPGDLAQRLLHLRRKREAIFGDGLFADPAWDMMLDLYKQSQKGSQAISTTSLCIASAVPPTTALRRIEFLIQRGLLTSHADAADRRRRFIALTPEGMAKMQEVLSLWADTAAN